MATFVLVDAIAYIHGQDFTGVTNKVTLVGKVDSQESTTFGGGGWRTKKGGLRSAEMNLEGFMDSAPDAQSFTDLGVADRLATVSATSTAGSVAYMFKTGQFEYEVFGTVGEMTPYSLNTMNTDYVGLVRGQVAKAKGNVSAIGALGSAVNLGAGSAGKYIYGTVHVFTVGTTVTIQVQTDDNGAFTTPTTVATIGPITTVGGASMTRVDASAITDTWYRLNVSAITGTFNLSGAIGVQ